MFFAKLFGKSAKRSPPALPQRPPIRPFDPKKVVAPDFEVVDEVPGQPNSAAAEQGFDPYNTGTFDKRNTWKRVPRL